LSETFGSFGPVGTTFSTSIDRCPLLLGNKNPLRSRKGGFGSLSSSYPGHPESSGYGAQGAKALRPRGICATHRWMAQPMPHHRLYHPRFSTATPIRCVPFTTTRAHRIKRTPLSLLGPPLL
jgi:hypothetical protein